MTTDHHCITCSRAIPKDELRYYPQGYRCIKCSDAFLAHIRKCSPYGNNDYPGLRNPYPNQLPRPDGAVLGPDNRDSVKDKRQKLKSNLIPQGGASKL